MKAIKNIRLKDYDYKMNGYYFVTICTDYRKPYLEDKNIKEIVVAELVRLNGLNGVKIDYFVVMPNHLHFIVILEDSKYSLSDIIKRFKSKTTVFVNKIDDCSCQSCLPANATVEGSPANATVDGLTVSERDAMQAEQLRKIGNCSCRSCSAKIRLWQPNYYEHVIRNEKSLNKIYEYIRNNPDVERYNWDELD